MKAIYKLILISALVVGIQCSYAQVVDHYDFTVSSDGTGDFKTVQEAINAVPDYRKNITTVYIKNGIYKEKLILPDCKANVKFIGETAEKTILTYDDFASKKNRFGEDIGTSASSSFFIFGDNFVAENITFENSAGPGSQAVAVRIDGDKIIFRNCRFLGFQDTLFPHGERSRQYYKNCYIEGTVDFIFGSSTTLFEECTIFCKRGGYVTAASTPETATYGFIFLRCNISGDAPEHSVYLGRPWKPFAKTVFISCTLSNVIKTEGWYNWKKPDAEKTAFYAEYQSTGLGANDQSRVKWSHLLNDAEAKQFSLENIFGDWKTQ